MTCPRPRRLRLAPFFAALALVPLGASCDDEPARALALAMPPEVLVVEQGGVRIRREVVRVDGVAPAPNPTTGASTPPLQNRVRVVRYRVDADTPAPARAVFVMMPGFLAGAGSFDGLARAIVARSRDGEAFEAWAIDRRSNLLEDTFGLDVAESRGDAASAYAYYDEQTPVEGRTFAGFLTGPEASWASEWGLATTVGDLRSVIARVPAEARKQRIVLLGHSLGASIAEAYAAWDFDGAPGHADLAALVLADGVARAEGSAPETFDRGAYENGSSAGPLASPGVRAIRDGNVFTVLPLLGVNAFVVAEALAIDAHARPDEVKTEVPARDRLLSFALGLSSAPRVSNAAAFGLPFDEGSALLSFAAARCGVAEGGALGTYTSPFAGELLQPTDPAATYTWRDGPSVGEPTRLADLARGWFEGPGLNFTEWYFPSRLAVDVGAASSLTVADDDWRSAEYGLRAKHGASMDLPIFGAPFRLVGTPAAYDALRALVKTPPEDFVVKLYPELSHIDGLVGADAPGSAAKDWYDDLVAFARAHTAPSGVVIP